jgi:hypothetical protein
MLLLKLNPIEPPWYGPVCPVVWEGRRREVSPYPDLGARRAIPGAQADWPRRGCQPTPILPERERKKNPWQACQGVAGRHIRESSECS